MWIRNTCKYGDNFVYLKIDPEKGINRMLINYLILKWKEVKGIVI